MTYTVIIDKCQAGIDYWKLNKSYLNWVRELVQRALTGVIINIRWWSVLKKAIQMNESARFSKQLSLNRLRIEG